MHQGLSNNGSSKQNSLNMYLAMNEQSTQPVQEVMSQSKMINEVKFLQSSNMLSKDLDTKSKSSKPGPSPPPR